MSVVWSKAKDWHEVPDIERETKVQVKPSRKTASITATIHAAAQRKDKADICPGCGQQTKPGERVYCENGGVLNLHDNGDHSECHALAACRTEAQS